MKRVVILIALMLAVSGTAVSCGEDRAEISAEVATEWVKDSINTVSEVLVGLLMVDSLVKTRFEEVPAIQHA